MLPGKCIHFYALRTGFRQVLTTFLASISTCVYDRGGHNAKAIHVRPIAKREALVSSGEAGAAERKIALVGRSPNTVLETTVSDHQGGPSRMAEGRENVFSALLRN